MIELLEFKLRGGQDAPVAATRVASVVRRYLDESGTHDLTAVCSEMVAWLAGGGPLPHTLRLELSITSTIVRVSVSAAPRDAAEPGPTSARSLRQTLPVTAALASRYGLETARRTRVWAELDRYQPAVGI